MKIPFVDLYAQYLTIQGEIDEVIKNVITDSAFIKGRYVDNFENNFKKKYGAEHCIGVANGTDAIYIALKMIGVGKGDEIITTASSWISTSEAISQTGAKPVFIDIEEDYYTINPDMIQEKINENTKGIIPVHLYGQPADMTKIINIAEKNDLFILEDCAQAHFAEFSGKRTGTFGKVSTFSFFPGKNLGAYGDAGCVLTDDDDLAKKIKMYANHGALKKHFHEFEGVNSRLDGLQAGILDVKLKHIEDWTTKRILISEKYKERLRGIEEVITPKVRPGGKHVFHIFNIRCVNRDGLKKYLEKHDVNVAIHYPTALPNMPAYKYLKLKSSDFPVVTEYQDRILSLPIYPEMTDEQIDYVVDRIKEFHAIH